MDPKGELQEASHKTPCASMNLGCLDNLTMFFGFIKLEEQIILNNISV